MCVRCVPAPASVGQRRPGAHHANVVLVDAPHSISMHAQCMCNVHEHVQMHVHVHVHAPRAIAPSLDLTVKLCVSDHSRANAPESDRGQNSAPQGLLYF